MAGSSGGKSTRRGDHPQTRDEVASQADGCKTCGDAGGGAESTASAGACLDARSGFEHGDAPASTSPCLLATARDHLGRRSRWCMRVGIGAVCI